MYEIIDFIEQYKVLEKWAFTKYDNGINGLEQYHPDKRIQSDLTYFRKIRNLLSHNPNGTTKPLIDIRRKFSESFNDGRRLDVIFITTTGDKSGDLVGLVTIWDLSSL